ncbi:uncharacterized protein SPSK_05722 [Sporothrix schenckii 1099-18]|uniref:Uncharacterized protein n=1 Tax=Sporothrix schenckii 1099-18 TaxID=1397361 RepID=A0A0F2LY04_SPOSC|nr:uncharacterized protein SPSK_05722 [Sporothrix schenckii 1099-18]KJR80776.1 hypothetical protein SPSK_05722 [Sporothrix schenckii 1099-18]
MSSHAPVSQWPMPVSPMAFDFPPRRSVSMQEWGQTCSQGGYAQGGQTRGSGLGVHDGICTGEHPMALPLPGELQAQQELLLMGQAPSVGNEFHGRRRSMGS